MDLCMQSRHDSLLPTIYIYIYLFIYYKNVCRLFASTLFCRVLLPIKLIMHVRIEIICGFVCKYSHMYILYIILFFFVFHSHCPLLLFAGTNELRPTKDRPTPPRNRNPTKDSRKGPSVDRVSARNEIK